MKYSPWNNKRKDTKRNNNKRPRNNSRKMYHPFPHRHFRTAYTHTRADQPYLIGRKNVTSHSRSLRNGPTSQQPTFNFFSIDAADTILLSSYRFFLAQNPPFYSAYRNNRIQQGFQRRFSFISKNVSRLLPAIFVFCSQQSRLSSTIDRTAATVPNQLLELFRTLTFYSLVV